MIINSLLHGFRVACYTIVAVATGSSVLICVSALQQIQQPQIHVMELGGKPLPPLLPPVVWIFVGALLTFFGWRVMRMLRRELERKTAGA